MPDGPRGAAAPGPETTAASAIRLYRRVLGRFVTGVTIVTTLDEAETPPQPWGTTVNAFSAVSIEPPIVMVAIGLERSIRPIIERSGRFAVNILPEGSQHLSDCFAGAPSSLPRSAFCGAAHRPGELGMPVLDAAIAHLECEIERELEAGDHAVLLGRVVAMQTREGHGLPLLYYRGRYLRIERAEQTDLLGKPDV